MSESAYGWPFLVARGRERGYRTILAPDFLTERRLHGMLSDAANGHGPRELEIERPGVGRLTLVCRTEQVTEAELDGGRDESLATDEHGRPLEILYGIVCRGRLGDHVDDGDLGEARAEALASYRRFLAEESSFDVDTSDAFALRGVAAVAVADAAPPNPAPRTSRRGLAVAAVVAALAALPFALMLSGGDDAQMVDVRACTLQTSDLLQGAVKTAGATDVVYHWEAPGWRSPSQKVAFERAGTAQLPPQPIGAASASDRAVLVVEQPEASRTPAPPCAP
jgi:hypothetical protein